MGSLQAEIEKVVLADNCSGCGACARFFSGVGMALSPEGFLRPEISPSRPENSEDAKRFKSMCPGVVVTATPAYRAHKIFGPFISCWQGWASDESIRFLASSGGVLTALTKWGLETGRLTAVTGSTGDTVSKNLTKALTIHSANDVKTLATSRYAPVSNVVDMEISGTAGLVAKPCEVSAVRQILQYDGLAEEDTPILLSFFCAGTPSQKATDDLVQKLDVEISEAKELRYRGKGWPGDFTVSTSSKTVSLSYDQSWGEHLGRNLQARCKICPNGTGQNADISVGDYWVADSHGYPIFSENKGNSVILARTKRGHKFLMDAKEAGVILVESVDLDLVQQIQPLQVARTNTLGGRLLGKMLLGKRVPSYRGFHVFLNTAKSPYINFRALSGMIMRSIQGRPLHFRKGLH